MKLPYSLLAHALLPVLMLPTLLAAAPVGKADKSTSIVQDTWSVPGIFGGGVKANDAYVDGSFFLTVPVYSTVGRDGWLAGDVSFLEPYTSWGEEGEVAVSVGLGWRHLFSGQSVAAVTRHDGHQAGFFEEGAFIGANLFADMLDTQFDNRFWQLGFGLEAGTRYVELRANYYLPLSDRQLAEEIHTQESFSTTSTVPTYHEPFATGHTIQQDVSFTTYRSTTTIERLFRRYEEGMEGWDAEVALLLPWIDRWMDVKVIGGYYEFDNQPFGPQVGGTGDVEGWKAGLEIRPVPAVVLNATWYEDDRLTGSDWTAGVRLEVPFEAGDLGDGKGFWDRIGDAFRPRRRHLAERLAEPVRRQNAAVKTSTSVEEDKDAAEVKVVTKVVSQSKQRIVLADTVVFVDNAIGSATNPGTYEAPVNSLQGGENLGNAAFGESAIIFVQGRATAYSEHVVLSQGTRLIGSSVGLAALGGKTFHGRTATMPVLDGTIYGEDISGSIEITGFEISGLVNQGFAGIELQRVTQVLISRNYVHDGYYGIIVSSPGDVSSSFQVVNNRVVDNAQSGIEIGSYSTGLGPSTASVLIDNNIIIGNGNGILLSSVSPRNGPQIATSNWVLSRNILGGNIFDGILLYSSGSSIATVATSANVLLPTQGNQIHSATPLGGTTIFIGEGTFSNTVYDSAGGFRFISKSTNSLPSPGASAGYIFINGVYHPANTNLP